MTATPLSPKEDPRLIALNYSSYRLFQNLNIWQKLAAYAAPIEEVHVSHRGHFGITRLAAAEFKLPYLGYVAPAKHINDALYDSLQNVTVIRPATLKNLIQNPDNVTLEIETDQGIKEIIGKIIIGADGTYSTVRDLLKIPTEQVDYQQTAIVTITELQRSHHHIAYERFLNNGAIAMLPLTGNRAATIWTDGNDTISQLMQLNEEDFLTQLQKQFGYRLGRLKNIGKRHIYPLKMIQAKTQIQQRVILMGNAAHTLSPIAAQGLNLALYEVASLVDYFNHHPLDAVSLEGFAINQQKISTRLSHHLMELFSKDFFIINTARQIGMLGLDLCHSLKERFAWQALGQSGQVPPLLREQESYDDIIT